MFLKNKLKRYAPHLVFGVLTLLMSVPLFFSLDPDFGWHMYVGQWMYAHHALMQNLVGYNYFANQPLVDHQWLAHLIFYPIFHTLGYGALIVLAACALLLTTWLLYQAVRQQAGRLASTLACSLFLLSYSLSYGVRVQVIFFLGAALLVYMARCVRSPLYRTLGYGLIFLLGNNLHGGFVILTLIPLLLELSLWQQGVIRGRTLGMMLGVIALALFLNPNGWQYWHLMYAYLTDNYYQWHIAEWLPIFLPPYHWDQTFVPLAVVAPLLVITPIWRRPWPEWLLVLIFGYLAIMHTRFMPLWLLLVVPYAAQTVYTVEIQAEARAQTWRLVQKIGIGMVVFLYGIAAGLSALTPPKQSLTVIPTSFRYIDAHPCKQGILLNDYNLGGYVLLVSQQQVFIDGRAPQLKLANGQTLLQAYDSLLQSAAPSLERVLQQYNVTRVLMQTTTLASSDHQALAAFLKGSAQWHLVDESGGIMLYQSKRC